MIANRSYFYPKLDFKKYYKRDLKKSKKISRTRTTEVIEEPIDNL